MRDLIKNLSNSNATPPPPPRTDKQKHTCSSVFNTETKEMKAYFSSTSNELPLFVAQKTNKN